VIFERATFCHDNLKTVGGCDKKVPRTFFLKISDNIKNKVQFGDEMKVRDCCNVLKCPRQKGVDLVYKIKSTT
jgi:hypothetical protein